MTTYLFPLFYVLIYTIHIYTVLYNIYCKTFPELSIPTVEGCRELALICAYNTQGVGHQALKFKYSSRETGAFTCLPLRVFFLH
jgi:hypothetical protein